MLDVHPPHESIHGWRDFLLHLLTITIGLLIALSLEGCVEWRHHRHLVHEAESSLYEEIKSNADDLKETAADIHKQQAVLKQDGIVLRQIIRDGKPPKNSSMEVNFHIHTFADVSWKTAQSTGALGYMSYPDAQKYSDIYTTQQELNIAENQAARDAILSLAPFMDATDADQGPNRVEAATIKDRIDVLQGQLLLLDSLVTTLDGDYKKFLSAKPQPD